MCNLCIKTKFIFESVVNSPFSESASKSNLFLDVISQPLVKLISLAGQKREFGRTEMGAWQDRNGKLGRRLCVRLAGQLGRAAWYSSLAEQKWGTWQIRNGKLGRAELSRLVEQFTVLESVPDRL